MSIKQRIRLLISELKKRGKDVSVGSKFFLKVDGENTVCSSEYEVFEELMSIYSNGK